MSETTTAAANTASKKAAQAAATVAQNLPEVLETAEIALEVPAKVVMKQPLVVTISILAGAGLGAGVFYGVQKYRNRGKTVIVVPNDPETAEAEKQENKA